MVTIMPLEYGDLGADPLAAGVAENSNQGGKS